MVYNCKDACAVVCADEVVTLVQQASGETGLQSQRPEMSADSKHVYIDIQSTAISSTGPPGLCASMPKGGLAETSPSHPVSRPAGAGSNKMAGSCRAMKQNMRLPD